MNIRKVRAVRQKKGLLHLSSKADYGFLLLMRLACENKTASSLRTIAQGEGLSFYFLQKVAADLRRAGLISAGRGKTGGYNLTKPADKITLKMIIEALDGPLAIIACLEEGSKPCTKLHSCMVRPGLKIINDAIIEALSSKTLYDLMKSHGSPGNKKPSRK